VAERVFFFPRRLARRRRKKTQNELFRPNERLTRRQLLDGEHHVDVADDVVVLREDRALPVDHRVGRRALLAKMHDGVGLERRERLLEELPVADVADLQVEVLPGNLGPGAHAVVDGRDGRERVQPEREVKLPAAEVVDERDLVTARREVEGRGPAAVAVAADDHDARAAAAAARGAQAVLGGQVGGLGAVAVAIAAARGADGDGRGAARGGGAAARGDEDLQVVLVVGFWRWGERGERQEDERLMMTKTSIGCGCRSDAVRALARDDGTAIEHKTEGINPHLAAGDRGCWSGVKGGERGDGSSGEG
jgi:hypothetical protein